MKKVISIFTCAMLLLQCTCSHVSAEMTASQSGFDIIDDWYLCGYHGTNSEEITVPKGVQCIGEFCFSGHTELKKVTLPQGLTVIEASAFSGCSGLESVAIQDGLQSIEAKAFSDCTNLKTIRLPSSLTDLQEGVFSGCTGLQSIDIPLGITVLSADLFRQCSSLRTVTLSSATEVIGSHCFFQCKSLQSLELPDTVTVIGSYAFEGCTELATLQVPETVKSVGEDAFRDTAWLKAAGDYVVIGDGMLYSFEGQQKILTIPPNVKTMLGGSKNQENHVTGGAVKGPQIVEIRFPDPDTEIQDYAINCPNAVIVGKPGSTAERYAEIFSLPFRNADEDPTPQGKDMTLDITKEVWSFGNSAYQFGEEYYLTDEAREHLIAAGADIESMDKPWGGSCAGMSIAVILMKNGIFSPAQLQPDAACLSDVRITDSVCSFVNYYQCIQRKDDLELQAKKFFRMLQIAENIPHGASPFLLTFALEQGSHGTVGWGSETGEWTFDGCTYNGRILIWDPNFPAEFRDDCCLYYDSETFAYCLPHYDIQVSADAVSSAGRILIVCNDPDLLNAYPYPLAEAQRGDLNSDGVVSIADAVLLCRFLTGQTALTDSQMICADLNSDKKLNAADLSVMKRGLLR